MEKVLPVCLIVTSSGCGGCKNLRGDTGIPQFENSTGKYFETPGDNKFRWDLNLFKTLATNFRVYEIHVVKLNPNNIDEFNFFELKNGLLIRTSLTHQNDDIFVKVEKENKEISNKKLLDSKGNPVSFKNYIKNNIPSVIRKYIGWFPTWIFIDGNAFDEALNDESKDIFAYVLGGKTVEDENTGKFKLLPPNKESMNNENINPVIAAKNILNGSINLLPLKINSDPENTNDEIVKIKTGTLSVCGFKKNILPYKKK